MEEIKKENIWNAPNLITFFRVIFALIAVFFILAGFDIICIVAAFIAGVLTDFFDGQVARRLNLKTEFGRKFDILADRILMLSVVLVLIIKLRISGTLPNNQFFQIFLILSREILTTPAILWAVISIKKIPIPCASFFGKATTFMQAFVFPMILLSLSYKTLGFSLYFAVLTSILGAISAFYYAKDIKLLIIKTKII